MYFTINDKELEALSGLTYIQQIAYLRGIRPYMDRKSMLVGIKRRISYQSLTETLYIEPHPGLKGSGSPSRQQIRRAIKGLERAGLVKIQSLDKQLILKCPLAAIDYYTQNKANTKQAHEIDTKQDVKYYSNTGSYQNHQQQSNTAETLKTDIPHKSNNYFVCLQQPFEEFWRVYPNRRDQKKAWDAFQLLNPDSILINKIMTSLQKQIENRRQRQSTGAWVPNWKNPANWLTQQCWNDDLIQEEVGVSNAKHTANPKKQTGIDLLWESCKEGAEFFDFDHEDSNTAKQATNIIQFKGSNTA